MKLIWHDQPDEAVVKKCRELEAIRKKEGQSMYWGLMREVLKTDPWFMMRVALEWGWLDDELVGRKFVKHIAENWGEDVGILFPRGHGKTLPMSAIIATAIIQDPNIAVLQISRTENNTKKICKFIADHLMYNDYLQQCFGKKYWDKGFLPSSTSDTSEWGKDGYSLPWRKPRIDPTLLGIPLDGAKAGKHPDIVWVDDPTEKENNDENGWNNVKEVIQGLWFLLPSHGFMIWTGTRWHDADPLGMAEKGKLQGKQGNFKFIKESCYVDDNILNQPTYPLKKRWNMEKPSGYTRDTLEEKRRPEPLGLGEFFDAQMRNDPIPAERADIRVKDINIYLPDELPKVGRVKLFGVEIDGGGLVLYNGFKDWLNDLKITVPLVDISNPRKVGIEKKDRIVAALQPIINSGKMFAQQWMIGEDSATEGLGYELRRLGKALHDDIPDCLHNVVVHMSHGIYPIKPEDPADLYIMVDLAWSEKKRGDWTVAMAVAVDSRGQHWIIDYDRFQLSSPTGIYTRLLAFYQKYEEPLTIKKMSSRKFPGAWR